MKKSQATKNIFLDDVAQSAGDLQRITGGLVIGEFIKLIRCQLKMSQRVLAQRAGVPQSTVSRVEKGLTDSTLPTLTRILNALSCDLVLAPMLRESIDSIRDNQAKKVANKNMRYLKGTMSLEKQQPDKRFLDALSKQEEEELLQGSGAKLWEE